MNLDTKKEVEALREDIKRAREKAKSSPLLQKTYLNGRAFIAEKLGRFLLRVFREEQIL